MNNYIDTLNETIKSYYKILSEDFPDFLNEYINTPEMLKQSKISVSCGTIYSKMYNQMWYSSVKKRYINPLVRYNNEYKRLKDISKKATNDINEALEYKTAKYVFLDFDFE